MALDTHIVAQATAAHPTAQATAHPADQQFRLLVDSVTEYAIFLLDESGRVMSWNAGAERIKGYRTQEIIGKHFSAFYPEEERAAGTPERLLARAEREGRAEHEGWRVRKDGSRFWADAALTALRGPAGELRGFAKVTRDMSARQRERENELMLAAMFERTPLGIVMVDITGRYVHANAQFLAMLGYSAQEIAHKGIADVAHPDDVAESWRIHEDLTQGRRSQAEYEKRYVRKNGQVIWGRNRAVRLADAQGKLRCIMAMVEDVTERHRAYETLREQRTLLAEAQSLAGLGCWEWDPASGRVTWSDELYRIYGVEPAAFQPSFESYLERVHPDDRDRVARLVSVAVRVMDRGFSFEERIVRPGGEIRQLRSHGEVVSDEAGRPLKVVGACLDITEQKAAEAALRALSRRLVQAEETERRRIARELHDQVGQNLSALNINLDIVLGSLKDPSLRRRLEDSLKLVDGTLQSIEAVMAELRPPLLDEYGLGAALAWYAEEYARRTGIRVSVDKPSEAVPQLSPEAGVALFRIAQEALTNVAKHAGATVVRIELSLEGEEMKLCIADDGSGFDPAQARRGRWGMTTMRERAEAAGGRLSIESACGQGTAVRATVPL